MPERPTPDAIVLDIVNDVITLPPPVHGDSASVLLLMRAVRVVRRFGVGQYAADALIAVLLRELPSHERFCVAAGIASFASASVRQKFRGV